MTLPTTPSQTVGPYLHIGLPWDDGPHVVAPGTPGAIRISGVVLDGEGTPVPDAMVETWQADPHGGFGHGDGTPDPAFPGFRGFGRSATDADGRFTLLTLKPGRVPFGGDGSALQAPHLDVSLFARGLLHRLVTRWYFADEPQANAEDPLLASVPPERRETLLLVPGDAGYALDLRIQGPGETVFFDL